MWVDAKKGTRVRLEGQDVCEPRIELTVKMYKKSQEGGAGRGGGGEPRIEDYCKNEKEVGWGSSRGGHGGGERRIEIIVKCKKGWGRGGPFG